MGKLGDALRAKYPSAKAAIIALGLDPALLDSKHLANDAKQRARREAAKRGMAIDGIGTPEELRAARDLTGEAFEREQRRLDRELEDGMVDDEEEEGGKSDEENRAIRRECMKLLAAKGRDEWGWDEEKLRHEIMTFPRTGLHHLGGALDEDSENLLEELGMGNGPTSIYERMPQSKDRKRRMAKDAKLMATQLGLDRLTPKGNELVNFGDREPLAMDGADDDGSFAEFYPSASRIRCE